MLPYTVRSRNSGQLIKNLGSDNYPVFFDGLHTTFYLGHSVLSGRKKLVRVHNIEHRYYSNLASIEKNPLKKIYYFTEVMRLKKYESILSEADYLLSVSETEQEYFESRYHNSVLVPSFHPFDSVESNRGKGEYLIYHGDLSVNENIMISEYLISEIFSKLSYKCIIAGKDPPKSLTAKAIQYSNISIIPDPDEQYMSRLIRDAQINILPVKRSGGLKLKLLMALFSGRHCLVNSETIKGTSLGPACHITDSTADMLNRIHFLMQNPFTTEMISKREKLLSKYYNLVNAEKLVKLIFR